MEQLSHSQEETEQIGADFAKILLKEEQCNFVALYGDLGVGKTVFVRGMARILAPHAYVQSPTYTMVNEYENLFHFDMYRITSEEDLYSIGYDDYFERNGICVVEWSENIPYAIPALHYAVTIQKNPLDENFRTICIEKVE